MPDRKAREAVALLTQSGSCFATRTVVIDGVEQVTFEHAPENLGRLYRLADRFSERTFLVYEDERLTYGEVLQRAHRLAHRLRTDYHVGKGDRVALAMRNYPEWSIAYLAATSIGAVIVPLNAWWQASELEFALRDCTPRVLIADDERFARLRERLPALSLSVIVARPSSALPDLPALPALPNGVEDLALLCGPTSGLLAAPDDADPLPDVAPDDPATLLYTSGSTGDPKGVLSTHRAVVSSVTTWELFMYARGYALLPEAERARVLQWAMQGPEAFERPPFDMPQTAMLLSLPLFHVTGCNVQFLPSFRSGRKLVLMRRWDPELALELIERERITDFTGVPTMSWELVNAKGFAKRDLSSLRTLGSGGAARPPEQVDGIRAKSQALPGTGYGMTETNGIGTAIAGVEYEARPASVGQPLRPIVEIKIEDEHGRALAAGEEGQICIKSVTNMRGYWNRPEETQRTLRDGFLQTGDLGHLDAEGYLFITGRAKDIVIRGGENISCAEVERAVYTHPSVFEVAAYGVPDARLGEALAISVRLHEGAELTPEELAAHVGQRLAKFKVPSHIFLQREPLPRIASGKLDKRALVSRFPSARTASR